MTDRCDSVSRRPREHSSEETSCAPTREESATASANAQQEAEREAELRRNAYFAAGSDEGGRSKHASSDAGAVQTSTPDDKTLRVINNAKKYDPPLQDDPLGNTLVGIAAGGVFGAAEAGAGKIGLEGARGLATKALVKGAIYGEGPGAATLARGAAAGVAASARGSVRDAAIVEAAKASVRGVVYETPATAASAGPGRPASMSAAAPPVAGQSSKNGASVPVAEPLRSEGPRIPEAISSAPVRIQG
jgi:hypothetical protein